MSSLDTRRELSTPLQPDAATVLPDNALWIRAVQAEDLPELCQIEKAAHAFPWELLHFQDCIKANYACHVLLVHGQVQGYTVAMQSLDEVHLLNVTVAPAMQGRGLGGFLLRALMAWSIGQGARSLWLEVREGNRPARAAYDAAGFEMVRRRKDYYPAEHSRREDALEMRRSLVSDASERGALPHG